MADLFIPAFILGSVALAAIVSGILGMAGGMVLMGLLAWILPVGPAMVLHAIAQFFANGSRAVLHRSHLHTQSLKYYALGLAVLFTLFLLFAFMPNKILVFSVLGIAPFISLTLPKNIKLDFTKPWHAFFCGMTVMGFQLTGGVSGPLLDMFFQRTRLTRHQTVATKAATQAISHTIRFVYFGFLVSTLADTAGQLPLWIFPAVAVVAIGGTHVSKFILEKMTDHQFYKYTRLALMVIGGIYICKAISLGIS